MEVDAGVITVYFVAWRPRLDFGAVHLYSEANGTFISPIPSGETMVLQRGWLMLAAITFVSVIPMCTRAAPDAPATQRIFDVLDLDHPGLQQVKKLHEQGDDDAAREALVEYIRGQDWAEKAPGYWEVPQDKDPDYSDPVADDLLENIFHLGPFEVTFGPEVSDITWYEPPMDQIDDVHLYYGGTSMNRHNVWMPQLAKAWWHTGDEMYAEKLVEILTDFMESCPIIDAYQVQDNQNYVTAVDEDGDGEPDRPGSAVGMVWKPFVTGRRVQNWKSLFVYCTECEEFTPELWCRIFVSIHEQVDSLVRKLPNIQNRSNHATRMGLALLDIAEFWPMMAETHHWRQVAVTKLGKAYNWFDDGGFIYPDGAQTEIK
ncbi:MAG: heparinase II/III family protein, partial [Armatimonadota bacterium]